MVKIRTMEQEVRPFLSKVLTMTGYKEDKEAFINEFIDFCTEKALKEYIALLPPSRRKAVKKIMHKRDLQQMEELLEPYTSTEEFIFLFEEQAEKLFQNFLKTLMPNLTEIQKNNLYKYFESDEQSSLPQSA